MPKIEQINELLRNELAMAVSREIPIENGMITVTYVEATPDLNFAKIGVSVLPEKYNGTALKNLRAKSGLLASIIRNKVKLRKIPKFNWVIDSTEKEAADIEKFIDEIE